MFRCGIEIVDVINKLSYIVLNYSGGVDFFAATSPEHRLLNKIGNFRLAFIASSHICNLYDIAYCEINSVVVCI